MLKKYLVLTAILLGSGCALAANTTPVAAPSTSQEVPVNPHRARDAKMRECKAEADRQQLAGEQRNIFVANCLKQ